MYKVMTFRYDVKLWLFGSNLVNVISFVSNFWTFFFERIMSHWSRWKLTSRLALFCIADDSMPFDKFCPSIAPIVRSRTCNICKQYFPSKKAIHYHKRAKICGNYTLQSADDIEMSESEDEMEITTPTNNIDNSGWPVIDEKTDEFAVRFEIWRNLFKRQLNLFIVATFFVRINVIFIIKAV